MQTISIRVEDIEIGERHRALSDDAVTRLAGSIGEIGLKQPISVRVVDVMEIDGQEVEGVPVLVAGRHRLEAAKRLGWSHIDCIEVEDDALRAELWELAENLHRHDLTKEQRDEHIRRYAELLAANRADKPGQTVQVSGGRGNKSIATEIAEETGLSARTVRRALTPKPPTVRSPEPLHEVDAVEKQVAALMNAWNRAGPDARAQFLAEIDTPVFDRTRCA